MQLRIAQQNEAEICYQCIEDARAYHLSLGFEQWHPDYPILFGKDLRIAALFNLMAVRS